MHSTFSGALIFITQRDMAYLVKVDCSFSLKYNRNINDPIHKQSSTSFFSDSGDSTITPAYDPDLVVRSGYILLKQWVQFISSPVAYETRFFINS